MNELQNKAIAKLDAEKDSFNKMLAAIQKLEDNELRRKYYGAAGKLADSVKNIAEAGE